MAKTKEVSGLEIEQNLAFQRRERIFERIGWTAMALAVVLALLGLLGTGPLSRAETSDETGRLRIEYERFLRHHAPATLTVRLEGEATAGGEVRLAVGREFLERVEISRVTPEPWRVEAGEGRAVFVFRVAEPGRPVVLIFRFEPEGPGRINGSIGLGDSEAVMFRQFVYP